MIDWAKILDFDREYHPDRGSGASIALFDSGIAADRPVPPNFQNLIGLQDSGADACFNRHAERIAMLAAGRRGVAPGATIYTAHRGPLFPDKFLTFLNQARTHPDIVGFPFSAPETARLALFGSSALVSDFEQADGAMIVASSGHDGNANVRFPGGCNAALTVGLMDQEARLHPRSGYDESIAKPDILILDAEYASQLSDGENSVINGSSAGVAIVCGVAAIWVERFRQNGWQLTPWALRSAMMAGCMPSGNPTHHWRQLSLAWCESTTGLDVFSGSARNSHEWILSITGPSQEVTLGIGMRISPGNSLWLPRDLGVSLYNHNESACQLLGTIKNHGTFDRLKTGKEYLLRLDKQANDFALTVVGGPGTKIYARPVGQTSPIDNRPSPQVIVGITASHDASACLVIDGEIINAIQLERITRKKHDGLPYLSNDDAVDYCLCAAGLTRDDVDIYAFNAQPLYPGQVGLSTPVASQNFSCFSPFEPHVLHVSHHLCHAFSAQILSPQPECAVLVIDGSGGSLYGDDDHILSGPELRDYLEADTGRSSVLPSLHVMSFYRFTVDGFKLLQRETAKSFNVRHGSSSIGETYAAVAQYIFGSWQASGKVMGLAPYGQPGDTFLEKPTPGIFMNFRSDWKLRYSEGGGDPVQDHAVLAATVQSDLETCLLDRIHSAAQFVPIDNLYYAGGVALNCKANQQIEKKSVVSRLTVFPASNDAGVAVGAAAAAYYTATGKMLKTGYDYHDYLGYPYTNADILLSIREYRQFLHVEPYDCATVAGYLDKGQILGWFEGGSEFGPRALGHRSILADPRSTAVRDRINRDVKYREEFRPFAPIALAQDAANWFDVVTEHPFMTHTVDVLQQARSDLEAITHVDGTARLQTITDACNTRIASLLTAFKALTGFSVLINTSLNMRSQPIIETPLQAVEFLLCSGLDRLVIGNYVLRCNDPFEKTHLLDLQASLAPDVELVTKRHGITGKSCLIRSTQRNLVFELPEALFLLLEDTIQNRLTLKEALRLSGMNLEDAPIPFLTALFAEKLILANNKNTCS
ncbi:MAG: carbamoyltransferase C-terminal domain-containing protein [Arenicellales bacterium]